jgi:hypothetical protein
LVLGTLGFSRSMADTFLFILWRPNDTVYFLCTLMILLLSAPLRLGFPDWSVTFVLSSQLRIFVFNIISWGLRFHHPCLVLFFFDNASMPLSFLPVLAMASSKRLCSTDGDPLSFEEATQYRSIVGGLHYPCPLLLTRCVNIIMSLVHLIGLQSNASYVMFATLLIVVCTFGLPPLRWFMPSPMQTGLAVSMICDPHGGYAIFYGGNLIAWNAHKQSTVSRSRTELECKALANAISTCLGAGAWCCSHSASSAMVWHICAIYLLSDLVFHARTKHIEVDSWACHRSNYKFFEGLSWMIF